MRRNGKREENRDERVLYLRMRKREKCKKEGKKV
jgi:hypothetical protein